MESSTFVLFGATGDLAKRKIYPALYNLFADGKLSGPLSVIGLGRRELSNETFQAQVLDSLRTFSRRPVKDSVELQRFLLAFEYSVLDVGRPEDYTKLLAHVQRREAKLGLSGNRMFYLSVGPEFFGPIAANIHDSGLGDTTGWKRLIIEKPFGRDLQSARELNESLNAAFREEEIFRIDHFLGKPMVQNLEVLKYSNPVLRALWQNRYIANVQITAAETVGVEERAGYYDKSGALRDMFQNHMLQLLMMMAMQLPKDSSPDDVRSKKRHVIRSVRPLLKDELAQNVVRGQYGAGQIKGKPVPAYLSEPGIESSSQNDTYIAARLWIDDPMWSEVPFYIRTGKRLKEKSTRIVIEFKEPFNDSHNVNRGKLPLEPNLLIIEIGPGEGISLQLNTKNPRQHGALEPVSIRHDSANPDLPEAYENLIYDALLGDATFFAHWEEVELSWQWVQPIIEAVEEGTLPLHTYAAGSYGPAAADELLGEDHWWLDEPEGETDGSAEASGRVDEQAIRAGA
ncbi:glucose-6-phosphate dehydrogenase [Paenibacillus sp. FSL R7-0273]|uniref:glucose-6-phosphate dehydrogenase n=1 Tax=Paenibacillus sp. FSL R7-0273 TaxID=1536772 RepID=UPI0004F78294|nr:glucose-6-phosphate dehydrogenase [Paenibacillus sp. FSL R7-0273]AIQ47697.1 glucose-6-phosphate dehydrogenase [Paenibacillus sp. FSL R7-0273]OMF95745.1 glucose-6-phosphate dehydrogenase [Paenibacillus sp. FSL R7-0273]